MGFSHSTCTPALAAFRVMAWCVEAGVQTLNMSSVSSRSRVATSSYTRATPQASARFRASVASTSHTATRSTPAAWYAVAWVVAIPPAPMMAALRGAWVGVDGVMSRQPTAHPAAVPTPPRGGHGHQGRRDGGTSGRVMQRSEREARCTRAKGGAHAARTREEYSIGHGGGWHRCLHWWRAPHGRPPRWGVRPPCGRALLHTRTVARLRRGIGTSTRVRLVPSHARGRARPAGRRAHRGRVDRHAQPPALPRGAGRARGRRARHLRQAHDPHVGGGGRAGCTGAGAWPGARRDVQLHRLPDGAPSARHGAGRHDWRGSQGRRGVPPGLARHEGRGGGREAGHLACRPRQGRNCGCDGRHRQSRGELDEHGDRPGGGGVECRHHPVRSRARPRGRRLDPPSVPRGCKRRAARHAGGGRRGERPADSRVRGGGFPHLASGGAQPPGPPPARRTHAHLHAGGSWTPRASGGCEPHSCRAPRGVPRSVRQPVRGNRLVDSCCARRAGPAG